MMNPGATRDLRRDLPHVFEPGGRPDSLNWRETRLLKTGGPYAADWFSALVCRNDQLGSKLRPSFTKLS